MSLPELPDTYVETRDALHQLAFFAVAPKRFAHTERLGLRAHPGVFGTPAWNDDDQTWVEGRELVLREEGDERRTEISTLDEACGFLGIEYRDVWFPDFHDPLAPIDPDDQLDIDEDAADALGQWFDFGTSVLESLSETPDAVDPTPVQLWPEHFDPATELGAADAGTKASYGASPGDAGHPDPYLYVSAWGEIDGDDPFWNARSFAGAHLSYVDLLTDDDPHRTALRFLRTGYTKLVR